MPSWNIHTAHVERLLAGNLAEDLGIEDANAFLFGNYVPDILVGFMVPDVSTRIDYCITHAAAVDSIPVPDADWFWDRFVGRRKPKAGVGVSLVLGAWAHLVADRFYNGRFREFCQEHDVPSGDELRRAKQGDFDLFGRSLGSASCVRATPELLEAAYAFVPYRISNDDALRAIRVANGIAGKRVDEMGATGGEDAGCGDGATGGEGADDRAGALHSWAPTSYQLLNPGWLTGVFDECNAWLARWLGAWRRLDCEGASCMADDVRRLARL